MSDPLARSSRGPAAPDVTVIVPTRGRPRDAALCGASILACGGSFELIVVDQSDDDETEMAVAAHRDPRVRYVRSIERGVSAGRNAGIALAAAPIIAFTDDDCRVPPTWLDSLEAVFAASDVSIVCGRVTVPPELARLGYAAEFAPKQRRHAGRVPPPGDDWGITANMAFRRSVFDKVGTFDLLLGAGSALRSGAEFDLLARAWAAGLTVINATEVEVIHLGIRTFGPQSAALWRGYGIGVGAAMFKHARCGGTAGARLYLRWLLHALRWNARSVIRRSRPTGLGFTAGFLRGTVLSLRYAVDPKTRLYRSRRAR